MLRPWGISDPPGSCDICPVCFWENDISQLRFARTTGANKASLIQGQQNYQSFGYVSHDLENK
jgi:hypothetical protein